MIRDRRKNLGVDQAWLAQKAEPAANGLWLWSRENRARKSVLILRTLAALGLSANVTDNTSLHRNRRANADKKPPIDINRILASLQKPSR